MASEREDDDPPRPGVNLGRTPSEYAVWGADMAPAPVGLPSGCQRRCATKHDIAKHAFCTRPVATIAIECLNHCHLCKTNASKPPRVAFSSRMSGARVLPGGRLLHCKLAPLYWQVRASVRARKRGFQHRVNAWQSSPCTPASIGPHNYAKIRATYDTRAATSSHLRRP